MKRLLISENNIFYLILKELNKNEVGVKFMMSEWLVGDSNDGNLLIQRYGYDNGRFDVINTFDETTYAENEIQITPVGITSLNGEYLTHPIITEVNYSPVIEFLVNADDQVILEGNLMALEEIRARLMQYQTTIDIERYDLDNQNNKIQETYKAVLTSGDISYGSTENFNGRKYMQVSMDLNIFVTNIGEFVNQVKFEMGIGSIRDNNGKVIFETLNFINHHYGTTIDTEATQLLNQKGVQYESMSMEVKSYPKTKAYGLSFEVQIDFDSPLLLEIYKKSKQMTRDIQDYYIRETIQKYDKDSGSFVDILVDERVYMLIDNSPPQKLSLGDKIVHELVFIPKAKVWDN